MSQCVPSWDLEDINPNQDIFKSDYEVAELTWKNGHLAMHELSNRRVPTKSQPTTSWDKPRAAETLEAIVNQATNNPYLKPQLAVNDDEIVPWLNNQTAAKTTTPGSLTASAIMTSDALVPSSNNSHRVIKSVRDGGCSTRVGSCSGDPTTFVDRRVAEPPAHDWSSCGRETSVSVSVSGTIGTFDTYDDDLAGQRLTSPSMGSQENISSDFKSTSPDDSVCHCKTKRETNEKKRSNKAKSSMSNKRRRTAAIHNQSERKRRDKINQRMTTLQKLVPNSGKTDKSSMLDEVIDYIKQLQAQLHMMNSINMSPMMMPLVMQQQQQQQHQMQMSMMGMGMGMGTGMGMGMGMGMGAMDMNAMGLPNIQAGFHPSAFMHMPSWNRHSTDQAMATDPMTTFLACRPQTVNMDAYSRMAALYQHMQNQQCCSLPKN